LAVTLLSESFNRRRLSGRWGKPRHYLRPILAFPLSVFTLSCALRVSPYASPPTRLSLRVSLCKRGTGKERAEMRAEVRAEPRAGAQVEPQAELWVEL